MAERFNVGDRVELRASYEPTEGHVAGVRDNGERILVTWTRRRGHEDQTTSERPADLRKRPN
jgi:hypothetical protein